MSEPIDMSAMRLEAQGVNAVLVQIVDGRRVISIACGDEAKRHELEVEARFLMRLYGIDE